jgi:tRNA(Ile2) C34 agmatinyltransferase TiaS
MRNEVQSAGTRENSRVLIVSVNILVRGSPESAWKTREVGAGQLDRVGERLGKASRPRTSGGVV